MSNSIDYIKLISDHCTANQIQAFVKKNVEGLDLFKPDVLKTKEGFLKNVKQLSDNNIVTDGDLVELITEGEENGKQHIFYFKVGEGKKSEITYDKCLNLLKLSDQISRFPSFDHLPTELDWVDFRKGTNGCEWVGRLVRKEVRTITFGERVDHTGPVDYESDGRNVTFMRQLYMREEFRLVYVIRLLNFGLFELRVGAVGNSTPVTLDKRIQEVKSIIAPLIKKGELVEWDLGDARRKMVDKDKLLKNKKIYLINHTSLIDDNKNPVEFKKGVHGAGIGVGKDSKKAMEALKKSKCKSLSFKLLHSEKDSILDRDLTIKCGGHLSNGIYIQAQGLSSEQVDYVTNTLKSFD